MHFEGLGSAVTYRDSDGRVKAAIVTATPASIEGTDSKAGISAPAAGRAHLAVFSFTGSTYPKHDVPVGDGPLTFTPPKELEHVFTP